MKHKHLETNGINLLAHERPDLLALICRDLFLPPTQLVYALQALEWYPDKDGIYPTLHKLLDHDSSEVRKATRTTLGILETDDPDIA